MQTVIFLISLIRNAVKGVLAFCSFHVANFNPTGDIARKV